MLPHLLFDFLNRNKEDPKVIPRLVQSFQEQDRLDEIIQIFDPKWLAMSIKELMVSDYFGLIYPKIILSENGFQGTDKWELVHYALMSEKTGPLQVLLECFPHYFRPRIIEKIIEHSIFFENKTVLDFMTRTFD